MHNEALIANTRDVQALGQHMNTVNAAIQDLANNQKGWNEYLQAQAKTAQIKADRATTRASVCIVIVVAVCSLAIADTIFTRLAPRPSTVERTK